MSRSDASPDMGRPVRDLKPTSALTLQSPQLKGRKTTHGRSAFRFFRRRISTETTGAFLTARIRRLHARRLDSPNVTPAFGRSTTHRTRTIDLHQDWPSTPTVAHRRAPIIRLHRISSRYLLTPRARSDFPLGCFACPPALHTRYPFSRDVPFILRRCPLLRRLPRRRCGLFLICRPSAPPRKPPRGNPSPRPNSPRPPPNL